jgi:hypothetical protein
MGRGERRVLLAGIILIAGIWESGDRTVVGIIAAMGVGVL